MIYRYYLSFENILAGQVSGSKSTSRQGMALVYIRGKRDNQFRVRMFFFVFCFVFVVVGVFAGSLHISA